MLREGEVKALVLIQFSRGIAESAEQEEKTMEISFDDDAEWYLSESDPAFIESIRRAREQVTQGQVITHEQLKKELNLNAED